MGERELEVTTSSSNHFMVSRVASYEWAVTSLTGQQYHTSTSLYRPKGYK